MSRRVEGNLDTVGDWTQPYAGERVQRMALFASTSLGEDNDVPGKCIFSENTLYSKVNICSGSSLRTGNIWDARSLADASSLAGIVCQNRCRQGSTVSTSTLLAQSLLAPLSLLPPIRNAVQFGMLVALV